MISSAVHPDLAVKSSLYFFAVIYSLRVPLTSNPRLQVDLDLIEIEYF